MAMVHDSAIPAGFEPGSVIAGKFRIERVLGAGAMGVVVLAWHLQLEDWVAIKFMLPAALSNAEAVARFLREARAAVKIKSEHIARVSDVGTLESGAPYMVMEYLQGQDLAALLAKNGPLPIEQATEFILQVCEALAEAHSLGIVHRDLKPANLFCAQRADGAQVIKVLDFGIAKAAPGAADSDFAMTKTSAMMGSPLYMSPEQLESARNVDARSDIWSLGAVLYELLGGRPPFLAASLAGLMLQITQRTPAPLQSLRADLPGALAQVIERCLEKERSLRYANVAELARALAPFGPKRAFGSVERAEGVLGAAWQATAAQSSPPADPNVIHSDAPTTVETHAAFGQTNRAGDPQSARRARYLAAFALVVGLLGGLSWFLRTRAPTAAAGAPSAVVASTLHPVASTPLTAAAQPLAAVEPPSPEPGVEVEALSRTPASTSAASSARSLPQPSKAPLLPPVAKPAAAKPSPAAKAPLSSNAQLKSTDTSKSDSPKIVASASAGSSAKPSLKSLIEDRK